MAEKSIADAFVEFTEALMKAGIPTEVIGNQFLSSGAGLLLKEIGTEATASRFETAAKTIRDQAASDGRPN